MSAPAVAQRCPACGADTFAEGTQTCSRCGYAAGEANRCPHCGSIARTEGTGENARCAVCGGPRIPLGLGGEKAKVALREQKDLLKRATTLSFGVVGQSMGAALFVIFGLLFHSFTASIILAIIALGMMFSALRWQRAAKKNRTLAKDASERAWEAAAEDAASRAQRGVTAEGLATTLGLPPARAERLLDTLAAHDRTRVDIGDEGKVRYSAMPEDPLEEATEEREEALREEAKLAR